MIKSAACYPRTMLATDHYPYYGVAMPNHELLEVHSSKISQHYAKAGYSYPTIRLPHTFSKLVGHSTHIYQTVHGGALAFLVVVSSADKTAETRVKKSTNDKFNLKASVLTWRRSPVRIRPSPSFFLESAKLEPSNGAFSDTRIMAQKKHNKDKKLHNSDEKLHNSHELDLSWQETVDLQPEDELEGGSEIYYSVDEDGNIHSREFLAEELIDDDIQDLDDSPEGKSRLEKVKRLKPGTTDIVNLVRPKLRNSKTRNAVAVRIISQMMKVHKNVLSCMVDRIFLTGLLCLVYSHSV